MFKNMSGAGLTRGGFYHHFKSKDQLYAAAVASFTTCNPFAVQAAQARPQSGSPLKLARLLVDLYLGDEVLDYAELQYLVVSVDLPVLGRITCAAPDKPFLAIALEIDVTLLREVMEQLGGPQNTAILLDDVPGPFSKQVIGEVGDLIQSVRDVAE